MEIIVICIDDKQYYRISDLEIISCDGTEQLSICEVPSYPLSCANPFNFDIYTNLAVYHLYSDIDT